MLACEHAVVENSAMHGVRQCRQLHGEHHNSDDPGEQQAGNRFTARNITSSSETVQNTPRRGMSAMIVLKNRSRALSRSEAPPTATTGEHEGHRD